jgi:7-carboxy-7-deazaguanine synthase
MKDGLFITIETEGSHFLETDYPINGLLVLALSFQILSLLSELKPLKVDYRSKKWSKQHNKFRINKDAIKKSIDYHNDYHIKPVLDKELSMVPEVEEFLKDLNIPDHKVWAMPAGDVRENLFESYPVVMDFVRDRGWRFTGRAHIMAFNDQREV